MSFYTPRFAVRQPVVLGNVLCTVKKAYYQFADGHMEPVYGARHDNVSRMATGAERPTGISYQVIRLENGNLSESMVSENKLSGA